MMGTAIRKTLVHGGAQAETARGERARRATSPDGTLESLGAARSRDGFADSIASALERLVSLGAPPPREPSPPLGMEASIAPLLFAPVIDGDEEDAEAAVSAQIAWGGGAAPRTEVTEPTSTARERGPRPGASDLASAEMAVWDDVWPDSMRPTSTEAPTLEGLEGPALREAPTLADEIRRACDEDLAVPLVNKRDPAIANEQARTRPTLPADVGRTDGVAEPREAVAVAKVGTVRVGLPPEQRDRLVRLRPPRASDAEVVELTPRRAGEPRLDSRTNDPRPHDSRTNDPRSPEPRGSDPRLAARAAGGSEGHDDEGVREDPPTVRERPHLHRGMPSKHDADAPTAGVQAAPIVSVPDAIPLVHTAHGPRPLETSLEAEAANGHPDEGAANAMPYQIVRLDDRHARVEFVHPELGRVEVDVRTDGGRVDVELLAKSLTSSIALRAGEESLRGEMRQRGANLRNYRVRTVAESVARALDEESR